MCGNAFLAIVLDVFAYGVSFVLINKMRVDKEDFFPPKSSVEKGLKFGICFPGELSGGVPGPLRPLQSVSSGGYGAQTKSYLGLWMGTEMGAHDDTLS